MSQNRKININIFDFREDPNATEWTLPPWGCPLGIGINPLFMELDGWISPVGTAFNVGGGVGITLSAYHCIEHAIKNQPTRNNKRILDRELNDGTLERCSFYILRNYRTETGIHFCFVPIERISAGPPADVAFCAAQFIEGYLNMENKISFELPHPEQVVHSIAYCDFSFPEGGIAISDVERFDWENDYSHAFKAVEGRIINVFTRNYAQGYVRGPCFTFSGSIPSGMSGGPIFDLSRGVIFGVNSATALDERQSIGSLLFPYVLHTVTFGANIFGDPRFRLNSKQNIIDMLEFGSIRSDGSHSNLAYQRTDEGLAVSMRYGPEYQGLIFEDYASLQAGKPPPQYTGPIIRRVKKEGGDAAPDTQKNGR